MIKGVSNTAVTTAQWMSAEDIVPYPVGTAINTNIYPDYMDNIQWLPARDNGQGLVVRWNDGNGLSDTGWDVYFYSVQLEKF